MTTQEMMKAKVRKGYWWVNIAQLGTPPHWEEHLAPYEEKHTPLFGYDEKVFLRKQYK